MAQLLIQPVILCGGSGTRLWPLSRADRPKPFLPLAGEESLLAATLGRVADRSRFARPLLVGSAAHEAALAVAGEGAGARLILEPCGRNTAPAAALAALCATAPDQALLIMPSDHAIRRPEAFFDAVAAAEALVRDGWLMTFATAPSRADTGFGYIRRGAPLSSGAFEVAEFVEKPDSATAARYLASGLYGWNSGIFMVRADRLLEALAEHAPLVVRYAREALHDTAPDSSPMTLNEERFARCPAVSLDVAVVERAERVATMPVDMGWSDVGSWDAVYEAGEPDGSGNVVRGAVEAGEVEGCYLHSDGPRIVVHGVRDLIVVATAAGVVVTRRGDSQALKPLIEGDTG